MLIRDPQLTHVRTLVAGAETGAYSLPGGLADQLATLDRLVAAALERPAAADESAARQRVIDAMLAAAAAGKPLPDATVVIEAQQKNQLLDATRVLIGDAANSATARLIAACQGLAERLVVDHLRPALDDVLAATTDAATAYAGVDVTDDRALLLADDDARTAWLAMDELARRYGAIRAARAALDRLGYRPQQDSTGIFSELRNLPDVWPNFRRGATRQDGPRPWPTDPRQRLAWLVTGPADPWLPTVEEQDERLEEHFNPDGRPTMAQRRAHMAATLG